MLCVLFSLLASSGCSSDGVSGPDTDGDQPTTDGDTIDGDEPDGVLTDGDMTDNDMAEVDLTEKDITDEDLIDDDAIDSDIPQCSTGSGPCCNDGSNTLYGRYKRCEESVIENEFRCSTSNCGGQVEGMAYDRYCDGEHWECEGERIEIGWQVIGNCADHQRCDPLNMNCEDFTFHDEIGCDGLSRHYYNSCGVKEDIVEECDDGQPCTQDSCHPAGCEHLGISTCDWPAEEAIQAQNLTPVQGGMGVLPNDLHSNLSGAVWNPETETLWICRNNNPSGIWAIQREPSGEYVLASKNGNTAQWWEFGDLEGLTQADFNEHETLYLIVEGEEHIKEVDLSTYGTAVVMNDWNTRPNLPLNGGSGAEGITFVPDEFLAEQGFVDGNGALYTSTEGMGGLMLVGHQAGGRIYAFDLNRDTGEFIFVGEYLTDKLEVAGLEFDRSTGLLYIWHGIDNNYLEVTRLSSTESGDERKLDTVRVYNGYSPPLFGSGNQEGIAILPKDECTNGNRGLFITTDGGGYYSLLLFKQFPCD